MLAGIILEMGGIPRGSERAKEILDSGAALAKFREIVGAQGGNPNIKSSDIQPGKYSISVLSKKSGYIAHIKNKDLVRIARAAGAPKDKGAGVVIIEKVGSTVEVGDPLFYIYADNENKLNDALGVARKFEPISVSGMILERTPGFTHLQN